MGSAGRKADHYKASSGTTILGLIHQKDGRWRILATGKRFVAASEAEAIATFYRLSPKPETMDVPSQVHAEFDGHKLFMTSRTTSPDFWPWLRELLVTRTSEVATKTGLPGLAGLDLTHVPQKAIKITELIEAYRSQSPSTLRTKWEASRGMELLVKFTHAVTLADLTTEQLTAWRKSMGRLAAGTQQAYFSRIKSILAFGLKIGMDQSQLRAALDRCRVLWPSGPVAPMQPHPMSREHFHALLKVADPEWRARLLIAMNCCFYLADIRNLKWADFDLNKKTYVALRGKTRIPRVAVLWDETVKAIESFGRRGASPFMFVSAWGSSFNRNSLARQFSDLRLKAGVPASVKFADIRDASFTAAAQAASDPRWAQVLAGHSTGMQDHYILRDPAKVAPACQSVYAAFAPFSAPINQSAARPA